MRTAIISLLLLLLLKTCGNPSGIELNQEFQLKYQEVALLKSDRISIQFRSVLEDSRCPTGVQCIQAGKATIVIEFDRAEVPLSTEPDSSEAVHGKYKIKLLDVMPYPNAGERTEAAKYVATLVITTS